MSGLNGQQLQKAVLLGQKVQVPKPVFIQGPLVNPITISIPGGAPVVIGGLTKLEFAAITTGSFEKGLELLKKCNEYEQEQEQRALQRS